MNGGKERQCTRGVILRSPQTCYHVVPECRVEGAEELAFLLLASEPFVIGEGEGQLRFAGKGRVAPSLLSTRPLASELALPPVISGVVAVITEVGSVECPFFGDGNEESSENLCFVPVSVLSRLD